MTPRGERTATTHHFRQVDHAAVVLKHAFGDDESPARGRVPLVLLVVLPDTLEDALESLIVAVVVPPDGRSRNLDALLDGKVDAAIGDDDVAALAERGDHGRDATERLGVDDGGGDVEERRNVALQFQVDIC